MEARHSNSHVTSKSSCHLLWHQGCRSTENPTADTEARRVSSLLAACLSWGRRSWSSAMEEEAICLHIVCITAQCFLPGSHNAACPQQFQRHPSRVHPGQAVSWDKDYLRLKVASVLWPEVTWCQRLLSKADFQNEIKSRLCHRTAVNWDHRTCSRRKVTGVHRLHEARIQRLWWVRSPFRTDYSRFCKVTRPRLIYLKCYWRPGSRV